MQHIHATVIKTEIEITHLEYFLSSPPLLFKVITHKQFIRYLMATHARLSIRELAHYLQKSTSNTVDRDKVRPVYELLVERLGQRVNEHNAIFLYEYLGLVNREDRGGVDTTSTTETTATTTTMAGTAEEAEEESVKLSSSSEAEAMVVDGEEGEVNQAAEEEAAEMKKVEQAEEEEEEEEGALVEDDGGAPAAASMEESTAE